jgi:hypothetical protein
MNFYVSPEMARSDRRSHANHALSWFERWGIPVCDEQHRLIEEWVNSALDSRGAKEYTPPLPGYRGHDYLNEGRT